MAHVLEIVVEHADQPYAERHGRIPALVDDPVEVRLAQPRHIAGGLLVHVVVVVAEQVARDLDRRDLVETDFLDLH